MNQNRLFKVVIMMGICLICSVSVQAHSLYIQSSRYQVHEGKRSPLFFCYGHHVPVDDGISGKKIKSLRVHSPSGAVQDIEVRDETSLHSYMVNYDTVGTYVLTAETNPGYYTVYIDKKGHERHTIKPKSAIMDKADKILKSFYSNQYTKTYVVCDTPSRIFPARVNLPLELVPAKDISTLKPGENLELIVYCRGVPYEGEGIWDATVNGFSTEAENNFYHKTVVSGSRLTIPIPEAGRWFVRYFIKTDATGEDKTHYDQMKHTATLVLELKKTVHH